MYVVLMNLLDFFSSSSSEETPIANTFELKARGKDVEDAGAADDGHSMSSKQNVAPESSPLEISDEHVSALDHNFPGSPRA